MAKTTRYPWEAKKLGLEVEVKEELKHGSAVDPKQGGVATTFHEIGRLHHKPFDAGTILAGKSNVLDFPQLETTQQLAVSEAELAGKIVEQEDLSRLMGSLFSTARRPAGLIVKAETMRLPPTGRVTRRLSSSSRAR